MKKNYSPWLHQLQRERNVNLLDENKNTDVLIIGAGIAGCMSAYYTIKNTNRSVILIDSSKAGHGASGHNAGQLTTYFERPLSDIATEYGVSAACEAQKCVEMSWEKIESLQNEINLRTPIYKFTGYAGITELKHLLIHLADNMIRYDGKISVEKILIADDFEYLEQIPSIYSHLYEVTPRDNILELLETDNRDYFATLIYQKGATNSAKICEEIINYLLKSYPDRFFIFENSPINTIILNENNVLSSVVLNNDSNELKEVILSEFVIESKKVILCTNGFEGFKIINNFGEDINIAFHHEVNGRINYMSAYLDNQIKDPVAISYFPKENLIDADKDTTTGEQYFYITRRPHIHQGSEMSLISTGGPEKILKEGEVYNRDGLCEEWSENLIDEFLKKNYKRHPGENITYDFCWHGLLGYTRNGLRLIGAEPKNKNLIYNLGCNGIGIMPSIFGADRVSKIINNEKLSPTIFDPEEHHME